MLEEVLLFLGLLIVLLPFYIQVSIYSLSYRVLKFNPNHEEITSFIDGQLPVLRRIYRNSLKRLEQVNEYGNYPTPSGAMFQRILAAIIPIAFVIGGPLGMVQLIQVGNTNRLIMYLFQEFAFVAALYVSWNFGASLETQIIND